MSVDPHAPFTDFGGWNGSILLVEGWGKREGSGGEGDWGSFSWTTAEEAVLYAVLPSSGDLDLHARCIPFPNRLFLQDKKLPETLLEPRQTITLEWNGRTLGTARLKEDNWQQIRIPLPDGVPRGALQRFAIRLGRTVKPSAISKLKDHRTLGAAFSEIAFVPRGIDDPHRLISELGASFSDGVLRLFPGAGWEFPVSAAERARVRFSIEEIRCSGCELRAEYLGPGDKRKVVWAGSPQEPKVQEFRFSPDEKTIGRLRLTIEAAADGDESFIRLEIPDDFIQYSVSVPDNNDDRPDVFVYLIDTVRADILAPYGGSPEVSPSIGAFATEAATYRLARTPASWTLPSVVSLLTGVYASQHGIMKGDIKYDETRAPSIVKLLSRSGYQTLAISQSFISGPAFGLDTPFSSYYLNDQLNSYALRSQQVRRFLLNWLYYRAAPEKPIFAFVHTVDPHAPYAPPGEYGRLAESFPGSLRREDYLPLNFMVGGYGKDEKELKHLKALYQGEVMYADAEFGRFISLLKYLGLYDNSLIVLVSDHGEEFGEHGGFDHGRTVYEELLRIPLIIKYPHSRWAGTAIAEPVSTLDLVPTLLEYTGLGADLLATDGSVLPPLRNENEHSEKRILAGELDVPPAEHRAAVNYRALTRDTVKCIQSLNGRDQFNKPIPEWRMFDLAEDPGEARPITSADSAESTCGQFLTTWQAIRESKQHRRPADRNKASRKSLERLRSLGYVK